jgi:hypothetical protein
VDSDISFSADSAGSRAGNRASSPPGCLLQPRRGPSDLVEQSTALPPDDLGISIELAHSRLHLFLQRRDLFL